MAFRQGVSIVVVATALLTAPAWAHHNMTGAFDVNDRVTLSGRLTKLDWRNPHIQIELETQREGAPHETWKAEGPPPVFFRNHDITKEDFQKAIAKVIKVEISRARDGSHSGLLRTITLPDDKTVLICPENC